MAVYLIEVPNNSPGEYDEDDVRRLINNTFAFTDIKVRKRHNGSLDEMDKEENQFDPSTPEGRF